MEKWEYYGKVKKVYSVNIIYFALAKGLKKAKETLDIMKLNDKERIAYNRKLENKSLEKSLFKSALMEHEYKTKIEIAKNLLDILDVETIAIKTGLSIGEIEELKRL